MSGQPRFWLRRDSWDLYTKAEDDAARHRERVREAIKKNLVDLVSEDSIVMSDGRRVVRVPLPTLEEFRFRFDTQEGGSGSRGGQGAQGAGPPGGSGHEGGQGPGLEDLVETDITLDTERKAPGGPGGMDLRDLARRGLAKNVDARRSLLQAARHRGVVGLPTIVPDDLRYRRFDMAPGEETGAVVLALMDTSGSMGTFEKFIARSFFFWSIRFLHTRYPHVDVVFVAHDVRAREVDENTFFHRGASGGTVSSSAYHLALQILGRYPADRYNAYCFHFTDGGNLTSDNGPALEKAQTLTQRVNLFGYGEIHDTMRNVSPLYLGLADMERARAVVLRGKDDVFTALTEFFGHARREGTAQHGQG
ncbi:MAG: DUF444 family protein [Clostridia bacterium]